FASPAFFVYHPPMLLLLLACADPAPPPSAATTPFDPTASAASATTVQQAIDELYRRQALLEVPPKDPIVGSTEAISAQLTNIEMRLAAIEAAKVGTAEAVTFDPRSTTLAARDVQSAIAELEQRLAKLEKSDPGKPGGALFELRDKNGNLVQAPQGGPPATPGAKPTPGAPPQGGGPGPQGGGAPRR
ncbi:MAG TPA: hypothetical protein PLA94_19485, partial [Myxococcota bacterium]|nr:hypothetical protein [Myxococcota bacterium]